MNNYQDHVHAAHDLKYPPALDNLPTSLSIENHKPVLTQCTGHRSRFAHISNLSSKKQDAASIYSQNSPLHHRWIAHAFIRIGQNFSHHYPAFSTTRFSRRQNASKSHYSFNERVQILSLRVKQILTLSLSLSGIVPITFYIPISCLTLPGYTLRNRN